VLFPHKEIQAWQSPHEADREGGRVVPGGLGMYLRMVPREAFFFCVVRRCCSTVPPSLMALLTGVPTAPRGGR